MIDQLPPRPDPREERPRPNWWARAGLIAGFVAAFGTIFIRAVIQTNEPERTPESLPTFPIETLVVAAIALWLSLRGREEAKDSGRGKWIAWAGIGFASLGLLFGLGQVGQMLEG